MLTRLLRPFQTDPASQPVLAGCPFEAAVRDARVECEEDWLGWDAWVDAERFR